MNPSFRKTQVLIIGGGVSGASLAIRLSKQGLKVLVVEKDKFPRHKLCGEFVSPECLVHFESLGILDSMQEIGGDSIYATTFFSEQGKSVSVPSEWFFNGANGALGISRSEMDFRLLQKAKKEGTEIFEESRVVGLDVGKKRVKSVRVKNVDGKTFEIKADLIIDATGRARVLGKLIEKTGSTKTRKSKIKHVAFKTHFENVKLKKGVCEIYFFRGGYGGLSYVENGVANHCFLMDSKIVREFKGDANRIFKEVVLQNKRAFKTMKNAEKKFNWLAVSVEKFGRQPSNDIDNLISIGDASAFIDPFTGSGMLMALESSEILTSVITNNFKALTSEHTSLLKEEYERKHAKIIRRRFQVCFLLHHLSFSPKLANLIITAASLSKGLLHRFTSMTRPIRSQ